MYLDDKHYAGDEDEQAPPPPPSPGTPPSSGPGLTGFAVGSSLLAIALLAAAAKPGLRVPIVGGLVLLTAGWLVHYYVTHLTPDVDPDERFNPYEDPQRRLAARKANVVFEIFFGILRMVLAIFTWGRSNDD